MILSMKRWNNEISKKGLHAEPESALREKNEKA